METETTDFVLRIMHYNITIAIEGVLDFSDRWKDCIIYVHVIAKPSPDSCSTMRRVLEAIPVGIFR